MLKNICVYCASSNLVAPAFFAATQRLGELLAQHNYTLVYGGGNVGLMGALARAVHGQGGRVVGVIPEALRAKEVAYLPADELVITSDLRERKAVMQARADAFIALPGGFGTLEEVFEILTSKQLGFHEAPIVFVNTESYYQPLFDFFEHIYHRRFAKPEHRELCRLVDSPEAALHYLQYYKPGNVPDKLS
ncbi:MAG: TIGR00730 family Rossman fold protein [bacterium]